MEEEMTPERTPHITFVSNVSSAEEEWVAGWEQGAVDTMQQELYKALQTVKNSSSENKARKNK